MLKYILRFSMGYLYVSLVGSSPERFLNLCRNNKIYTWKVRRIDSDYVFYMYAGDYKKINNIYLKTGTYPHIINKNGLIFRIRKLLRRKSLLPSFVLFIIMIYFLSFIVWDIDITGEMRHTDEEIREYLKDIGVYEGMITKNVDGNAIEKSIRNTFNDISWVSVELSGCNIHIKLLEADVMEDKSNKNEGYSSIVAASSGIVDKIMTRSGTPLVRPGDEVEKGQVLVSGIVELHNDGGEVIKKCPVYADADIYINTTYNYSDEFSMIYPDKQYTGSKKEKIGLNVMGRIFFLENPLNRFKSYEKYDIMSKVVNICGPDIVSDNISLSSVVASEYETVYRTYNNKEAVKKARYNLRIYLNTLHSQGIIIGSKNITAGIKAGKCITNGFINVCEPQIERIPITENDWSVDSPNEQDREDN